MKRYVLDHDQVMNLLPDRACDGHKGDFGKVLLLCGSRGYTGAAALAAMGAHRRIYVIDLLRPQMHAG